MRTLILSGLIFVTAAGSTLAGIRLAREGGEPEAKKVVRTDPNAFYTFSYQVPPGVFGEIDPKTGKRSMARAVLEEQGVAFSMKGASAVYNPGSKILIVRNTPPQLELVEAFIEKLMGTYAARIQLAFQVIETEAPLFPKTGNEDVAKGEGPLPVSKVLSEKEAKALFKKIDAEKKDSVLQAQPVMVNSGRRAQLWIGDLVAAIDPVLAADKATIDLKLGLIIRTPDGSAAALPARQATIQPGQTVAVERKLGDARFQTALVTANVVDLRGKPEPEKPVAEVSKPADPGEDKKPDATNLITRTYDLPLRFVQSEAEKPMPPPDAIAILRKQGVAFPEGATAVYNSTTGALVVRNTPEQIELVDAVVKTIRSSDRKLIYLHYQVAETKVPLFPGPEREAKAEKTDIDPEMGARELPLRKERALPANRVLVPVSPVSKVLEPGESVALLKKIEAEQIGKIRPGPKNILRSGAGAEMWIGDLVMEIHPILNPDDVRVDLNLGLMIGKPAGVAGLVPLSRVIVEPGQTMAVEHKRGKDCYQTALVTARILDPSGRPVGITVAKSKPKPANQDRKLTREEMESVRLADEVALRGSQKLADGDYEAAVKDFQVAVEKLPDHPICQGRRDAYTTQLKNSRHRLEESKKPPAKASTGIEKLKTLVVPVVNFRDTPLEKALAFLEGRSVELDRGAPEDNRGVRIVLADGLSERETAITLRLSNVPLGEALRYTLKLANCQYEIEGQTVKVAPMTPADRARELFTNTYIVPPNFLMLPNAVSGAVFDPFALPSGKAPLERRPTAKEVLENYGITFGPGSAATYNSGTSTLIVRQTADQMDLVEAVVKSLTKPAEKQVHLVFRVIETEASLFPEIEQQARARDTQLDSDSGARLLPEMGSFPYALGAGPPPPVAKVLNIHETEALLKEMDADDKARIRLAPSLMARSGQRAEMWIGDLMAEVDPVIGADLESVDLNFSLMIGKPAAGSRSRLTQVTIWDGETVAIERKRGEGRYQTALLTAEIVDEAGFRIRREVPVAKPGKLAPSGPGGNCGVEAKVEAKAGAKGKMRSLTRGEQGDIQLADDAALRGSKKLQAGAYEEAAKEFHTAVKKLPDHPIALERRDAYTAQLWRALLYAEAPAPSAGVMKQKEQEAAKGEPVERQIFFTVWEIVIDVKEGDLTGWFLEILGMEKPDPSQSTTKGKLNNRIAGVFTDPQFQLVARALRQQKGNQFTGAPSVLADSGGPVIVKIGERRVGLVGKLNETGHKIDLGLYFAGPGEPVFEERGKARSPTASLSIWDRQVVAYVEPLTENGEKVRLSFVSSKVVIQPPVELPEKETPETVGGKAASLFPEAKPAGPFPEVVLRSDERLIIHEVKKGETLYQLARKHGATVSRIKDANRMRSDMMSVGDRILIPVKLPKHLLEAFEEGGKPTPVPKPESESERADGILEKVRSIVLPSIDFADTPLPDVLEFLRDQSVKREGDSGEGDHGFDFVLKDRESLEDVRITLKLRNVPLHEAIRYTAQLANCDYQIEGRTVTMSSKSQGESAAGKTRKEASENKKGFEPEDAWYSAYQLVLQGEVAERDGKELHARAAYSQAEALFKGLARSFPDFHPNLVKYRLNDLKEKQIRMDQPAAVEEKRFFVTIKEVESDRPLLENLDAVVWKVLPVSGEPKKGAKSTFADSVRQAAERLRRHDGGRAMNEFLDELSQRPGTKVKKANPGPRGKIAAVFTDPQFQLLLRALTHNEENQKAYPLVAAQSDSVDVGQPFLCRSGDRRWGVVLTLSPDELEIELDLYLPRKGEPLFSPGQRDRLPSARITLPDDRIVAYEERLDGGRVRTVFVWPNLVTPVVAQSALRGTDTTGK